jgi:hypothetical protein
MTTDTQPKKAKHLFGPGNPGKPKGATAHINRDIKEMVLKALSEAGGAEYLYMQALDNPKAFLGLVAKVLPMTLATDPHNPVGITVNIRQF